MREEKIGPRAPDALTGRIMEAAFEAIATVRAYGASLVDRAEYLMHHVGTHHNLPRGVPQSLVERVRKASRKLETLLKRLETAAPDDEAVDGVGPMLARRGARAAVGRASGAAVQGVC